MITVIIISNKTFGLKEYEGIKTIKHDLCL